MYSSAEVKRLSALLHCQHLTAVGGPCLTDCGDRGVVEQVGAAWGATLRALHRGSLREAQRINEVDERKTPIRRTRYTCSLAFLPTPEAGRNRHCSLVVWMFSF